MKDILPRIRTGRFTSSRLVCFLFCGAFFVMPMGTSPFTILGGLALLTWLFSGEFLRQRRNYIREPWFFPVVAVIALTFAGLIWSADPSGLGIKYAKKAHYWLYAFAVASVGFSKHPAQNLIKAFLLGLFINALAGFLQLADMLPRFSEYGKTAYTGFYGGYNTLAILLILGMMTASFLFRSATASKEKIVYVSLIPVYIFHLALLEGRGGYLAFLILLPVILFQLFHGKRVLYIVLAYILVVVLIASSPVVQFRTGQAVESLRSHFNAEADVFSGKKYSGYMDRIYMWRWAIDLFLEHPLIGVGTGGYTQSILQGGGGRGIAHPHNNILYVAVSYGILGLIIFGWLFWVLLKAGWRNRDDPVGFFILSSTLVILVGGLTDTHILDAGGAFLLAVTTGLLASLPSSETIHHRGTEKTEAETLW